MKNNSVSPLAISSCCLLLLSPGWCVADALEIYGLAHLSFDHNDTGTDTDSVLASNSSRLGISGNLELGSDHTAFFQYEPGIDLTGRGENDGNGPGRFDSLLTEKRDSFVGLRNKWGEMRIGRLGILNHWLYDFDPFADLVGDLGNLWGASGIPGRANRAAVMEIYGTESIGGTIHWADEYDSQPGIVMGKLSVAKGDLRVNISALEMAYGSGTRDQKALAVTGDYRFAQGVLGFGLQTESDIFGVNGNDRTSYTLGYTRDLAGGNLKLQYSESDSDHGQLDGSQWALAYEHGLGKDWLVYGALGWVDNDSSTGFSANNYGHGLADFPQAGEDPTSWSLGIIYQFRLPFLE